MVLKSANPIVIIINPKSKTIMYLRNKETDQYIAASQLQIPILNVQTRTSLVLSTNCLCTSIALVLSWLSAKHTQWVRNRSYTVSCPEALWSLLSTPSSLVTSQPLQPSAFKKSLPQTASSSITVTATLLTFSSRMAMVN